MRNLIQRIIFFLLCLAITVMAQQSAPQCRMDEWEALQISLKGVRSDQPTKGFVPDEPTAVRIGEAVAIAEYGEQRIAKERPFRARLYGNTWLVKGTLHPQGVYGGTAVVKISKQDGKILFLTHQY
jgi:hypothetical protein